MLNELWRILCLHHVFKTVLKLSFFFMVMKKDLKRWSKLINVANNQNNRAKDRRHHKSFKRTRMPKKTALQRNCQQFIEIPCRKFKKDKKRGGEPTHIQPPPILTDVIYPPSPVNVGKIKISPLFQRAQNVERAFLQLIETRAFYTRTTRSQFSSLHMWTASRIFF